MRVGASPGAGGTSPGRRPSAGRIAQLFGVEVPGPEVAVTVEGSQDRGDHVLQRVRYRVGDGDQVPAWLALPSDGPGRGVTAGTVPGVVAFHQHASRWHLGKSEVAGLAGEPLQAFAPALARRGVAVLAPDSVCFEDRRRQTSGVEPHHDDLRQHYNEHAYRLLAGDTLGRKVLQDALAAVSALRSLPGVARDRVGVVGHSYGGQTALLVGAVDRRVAYVCASGSVGSLRGKVANEVSVERALVVPGLAREVDVDGFVAAVAPRPLLVVAGVDDRHALDAAEVVASARPAYVAHGVEGALELHVGAGGHALTEERHALVVGWVAAQAHQPGDRFTHRG